MKTGFSENESRAYISLLRKNPSTAYEVSKDSGIPSSKIYGLLEKLKEKGIIQEFKEGDRSMLVPMDMEDFIEGERSQYNRNMDDLKQCLKEEITESKPSYVWNISNREEMLQKIKDILNQSSKEILLSLWPEEYRDLEPEIQDCSMRKLNIAMISFGDLENPPGKVFRHPIEDTLIQEKGGRGFVIVSDSRVALMGTVNSFGKVEASWSRSDGFASLAEDYVRHDIYIMKIVKYFDSQIKDAFGENYQSLRKLF